MPAIDHFFFIFKHIYKLSIAADSLTRASLITSVCFTLLHSFLKSLAVQTDVRPPRNEGNAFAPLLHSTRPSKSDRTFNILLQLFMIFDILCTIMRARGNVLMIMATPTNWRPLRRLPRHVLLTLSPLINSQLTRDIF